MEEKITFQNYFKLLYDIAENPSVKYECKHNPQVMFYELVVSVLSVNNIRFENFGKELDNCIKNGINEMESYISNSPPDDATNIIQEFLKELQVRRSLVYKDKSKPGFEYYYFFKAKFDDGKENRLYIERITKIGGKKYTADGYEYKQIDTEIEKYDIEILRIQSSHFAFIYVDRLDSLKFQIDKLYTLRLAESVVPETQNKKYELRIGKGYSAKELVYLFNILSRIDFFMVGEHDHEKIYKAIANIYLSPRGEDSNKYSNVKKCWLNSGDDRITQEFCDEFRKKVLRSIEKIVADDICAGYDPARKKNK